MAIRRDFEAEIEAELLLAESSGPHDPLTMEGCGVRSDPEETVAYEARLTSLRGAYEVASELDT